MNNNKELRQRLTEAISGHNDDVTAAYVESMMLAFETETVDDDVIERSAKIFNENSYRFEKGINILRGLIDVDKYQNNTSAYDSIEEIFWSLYEDFYTLVFKKELDSGSEFQYDAYDRLYDIVKKNTSTNEVESTGKWFEIIKPVQTVED